MKVKARRISKQMEDGYDLGGSSGSNCDSDGSANMKRL